MSDEITFIHAADLHLDSPYKGLSHLPESIFSDVLNGPFKAFDRLVETAIEKQVDFVLLVGDLFDNERQSLKAQIHLRDGFEVLNSNKINVYLSYGNHDDIQDNSHRVKYPDNVFAFPDETIRSFIYEKNSYTQAAIYGFSYENQAVLKNKSIEYVIKDETIPFHIATLHGSVSSNTEHDTYAPFKVNDLTRNDFDYWALGHIHQRQKLHESPPIIYPGNIQGRHRKETGEKGCYYVTLTKHGSETTFLSLASIQFKNLKVNITDCETITDIEYLLKEKLDDELMDCSQLLHLNLEADEKISQRYHSDIEELVDILNDVYIKQKYWLYIYRIKVSVKETGLSSLYQNDHFIGEVIALDEDTATIKSYLKELYDHKQARKHLEKLDSEELREIEKEAKQMLINDFGL